VTAVEWHHSPPVQADPVNTLVLQTNNCTVGDVSGSDAVVVQVTVCPGFLAESSEPDVNVGR
jgi:hypothetical protein